MSGDTKEIQREIDHTDSKKDWKPEEIIKEAKEAFIDLQEEIIGNKENLYNSLYNDRIAKGPLSTADQRALQATDMVYKIRVLKAMNFRDSEIASRKKEGKISEEEINQILSYDPLYAQKTLKAMNFRDSEIASRKKEGNISDEEIELMMKVNPIYAMETIINKNKNESIKKHNQKLTNNERIINVYEKDFTIINDYLKNKFFNTPKGSNEIKIEPAELFKSKETPTDKEYTVQSGDTLWDIVKKEYGVTQGPEIAKIVNKIVAFNAAKLNLSYLKIDKAPKDHIKGDILKVGHKIMLPPKTFFQ